MNLVDYLRGERGNAARLASQIGVAPAYLSQMANGLRPVAPAVAVAIEQATGRAVMRWALRPTDWWLVWPELIDHPHRPQIPQPVTQPGALDEAA